MPLTAEELALIEAGVSPDEPIAATGDELTDVESLSEQLALHSIESEARHEQILENVEVNHQCLLRLEASSPETTQNPVSQAMLTELTTLKTELAEIKGMLTALQASLISMSTSIRQTSQSESSPESMPVENPVEQNRVESTEEPRPEETARRKHRVL